jgi:hypothetical protein
MLRVGRAAAIVLADAITEFSLEISIGRAIGRLPPQFRLDKKIEIAIHHSLDITRFRAGPMVLHHLVRLKDV